MSDKIKQALSAKPFRIVNRGQLAEIRDSLQAHLRSLSDYRAALAKAETEARTNAERMAQVLPRGNQAAFIQAAAADAKKQRAEELTAVVDRAVDERRAAIKLFEDSKDFYGSRLTQLDMLTLGDPRRLTYQQTLATANPASLQNAARHAVATGNAALAAAVINRMQQETSAQYSVSINQIVSELAHEELDKTEELFNGLTRDLEEVTLQIKEIVGTPASAAMAKIERGLSERRRPTTEPLEDAQEGQEASEAATLPAGVDRIARGLAARSAAEG